MKSKLILAYALLLGQIVLLATSAYMFYYHLSINNILFKATKVHLSIQIILCIGLIYSLHHFIRVIKISSKMRKAAREQREAKSKRIEVLVYALMTALIFTSLFYTVPFRRYVPLTIEYGIYIFNSVLQLLMLISLISAHAESSEEFSKSKQKYAATGAASGLLLFYVYFQLIS